MTSLYPCSHYLHPASASGSSVHGIRQRNKPSLQTQKMCLYSERGEEVGKNILFLKPQRADCDPHPVQNAKTLQIFILSS